MRNKETDYKLAVLCEFPFIKESNCTAKIMKEYGELPKNSKPKLNKFINEWYKKLYTILLSRPGIAGMASEPPFERVARTGTYTYIPQKECTHGGMTPVKVGSTECLYLTGTRHVEVGDPLPEVDYIVALDNSLLRNTRNTWQTIFNISMQDMGGVSDAAMSAVPMIAKLLLSGKRVLMYCVGSHGRTGTMLAMLIAHMEPDVEDPVAEARSRHCERAVETYRQIEGIFKFAGKPVPTNIYGEPPAKNTNYQQNMWQGHMFD